MRYTSRDPATGRWLGSVPAQSAEAARLTLDRVAQRQRDRARLPLHGRLDRVTRLAEALSQHRHALAEQVCLEVGKPLREARQRLLSVWMRLQAHLLTRARVAWWPMSTAWTPRRLRRP